MNGVSGCFVSPGVSWRAMWMRSGEIGEGLGTATRDQQETQTGAMRAFLRQDACSGKVYLQRLERASRVSSRE